MELEAAKRRLKVMIAIDVVCGILAVGAAYGVFVRDVDWLIYVLVVAVLAGLAAQIWFIVGLRPTKKGV